MIELGNAGKDYHQRGSLGDRIRKRRPYPKRSKAREIRAFGDQPKTRNYEVQMVRE